MHPHTRPPSRLPDYLHTCQMIPDPPPYRLVEKPWSADPVLSEIINVIVKQKQSIMKVIRNSDIFKHIFRQSVMAMADNTLAATKHKIVNTSTANFRFDSVVGGLQRAVLLLDPLLVTVSAIHHCHGILRTREASC